MSVSYCPRCSWPLFYCLGLVPDLLLVPTRPSLYRHEGYLHTHILGFLVIISFITSITVSSYLAVECMSKIVLSSVKYFSHLHLCLPWKILSTYLHIIPNETRNTGASDWIFKGISPQVDVFLAHSLRNFIKHLCFPDFSIHQCFCCTDLNKAYEHKLPLKKPT